MNRMLKNILDVKLFLILSLFAVSLSAQIKKPNTALTDTTKRNIQSKLDSSSINKSKISIKKLKSSTLLPENISFNRITKNTIGSIDYKFTGDLLKNSSFIFLKDLGYTGLPNEMLIYGQGNRSSSFFNSGIEISNRLFNSFDLNLIQSESIDSIEIMPLSRGFLLSNSGTAVVNFIQREPTLSKPYSIIKYYQAPDDEGFMDGIFSINPFKKTNVYFEITNHSNGARYKSNQSSLSDYSNWMGDFRVNYFYSDKINLRLNYKYASSTVKLFGGVDADTISQIYTANLFETVLYDNILAPVRFKNRYQSSTLNHVSLSVLMNLVENAPSEFSIYHLSDLTEYRQNLSGDIQPGVPQIRSDNKAQTTGAQLRQDYTNEFLSLKSITKLEHTVYDTQLFNNDEKQTTFSSSMLGTVNISNGLFTPSLFAKYLNLAGSSYLGFGADAVINIGNNFNIYSGYSHFSRPTSLLEQYYSVYYFRHDQNINSAELMLTTKFDPVRFSLGYFITTNDNELLPMLVPASLKNDEAHFFEAGKSELHGINSYLEIKFWKLMISSNTSFYFSEKERIKKGLPEFTSLGGIYYIDTLFNRNLKLKTGINYYSYGSRYEERFDFEKGISSSYIFDPTIQFYSINEKYLINSSPFSPSIQMDFFLAGRIQDVAVIYFVWENILNSKYSVIPYYTKPASEIRFGFSWEFFD